MRRLTRVALALSFVAVTAPPAAAQTPNEGPEVFIAPTSVDDYGLVPPSADKLTPRSVLRMTVIGFESESTGVIEQCSVGGCANPYPVTFDLEGRARIQYLVHDDFASGFETPSTCRAAEPACVVRIRTDDRVAFLSTVFRDSAPPARIITVKPDRAELVDGTRVRVSVTGFTPGARVQATFCVAPDTFGREHCGAPGPLSPFTIGANGTGSTTLAVREGRVGSAGASCGGASQCGIVVTHPRSAVSEAFVAVEFSDGPAAQYDVTRSLAGLSAAAALIALAYFLVRRTDWRKPTEADTPDLDNVVFTEEGA